MSALTQAAWFWAMVGAAVAVTLEYLYRVWPGSFWSMMWWVLPANVLISYTVYRLVTAPNTSLIDAFIVWTFSTIGLRVLVSVFLLGDPVKHGTWFALALVVMARIAQVGWK